MSFDNEFLGMDAVESPAQAVNLPPQNRENKTIFRLKKPDRPRYTVISNTLLNDARISWEAKGLMCFLLSKKDDWTFNREDIMRQSSDKECALKRIIGELKSFGYIKIEKIRDEKGRIVEWVTYVFEHPESLLKNTVNVQLDKNQHVDMHCGKPVDNFVQPVDKSVDNFETPGEEKTHPPVTTRGYPEVGFSRCGKTSHIQILSNKYINNKITTKTKSKECEPQDRESELLLFSGTDNESNSTNQDYLQIGPEWVLKTDEVPTMMKDFSQKSFTLQTKREKISPADFKLLTDFGYNEVTAVELLSEFEGAKVRQAIEHVSNLEAKRPNSVDRPLAYVRAILNKKIEISSLQRPSRCHPTIEETKFPKFRTEYSPESLELASKTLDVLFAQLGRKRGKGLTTAAEGYDL